MAGCGVGPVVEVGVEMEIGVQQAWPGAGVGKGVMWGNLEKGGGANAQKMIS